MLADEEQPLLVQLNWHKDDREGRFLLRRMDETTYVSHLHQPVACYIHYFTCCITFLINSFSLSLFPIFLFILYMWVVGWLLVCLDRVPCHLQ